LLAELRVQACAGCGQRLQGREGFERAIDQHAAGGMRRFTSRLAALDDQNTGAFSSELYRQREPDDAAANNDHVPVLHLRIVKESVTFVTRYGYIWLSEGTVAPPIIRSSHKT